jgi:hypothetical protein
LFLTAKARPILGRIWNVANETRDEALALLSAPQAETLIDLLGRVHATLSANSSAGGTKRVPADGGPAILPARRAAAEARVAQAVPEAVGAPIPAVEGAR